MITSSASAHSEALWICIGLFGQILFFMRFFVQWIASEKERRSVIPPAFWYFSLTGGAVLLCYALWRADPIFVLGQACGLVIYGRNLYFLAERSRTAVPASG